MLLPVICLYSNYFFELLITKRKCGTGTSWSRQFGLICGLPRIVHAISRCRRSCLGHSHPTTVLTRQALPSFDHFSFFTLLPSHIDNCERWGESALRIYSTTGKVFVGALVVSHHNNNNIFENSTTECGRWRTFASLHPALHCQSSSSSDKTRQAS